MKLTMMMIKLEKKETIGYRMTSSEKNDSERKIRFSRLHDSYHFVWNKQSYEYEMLILKLNEVLFVQ